MAFSIKRVPAAVDVFQWWHQNREEFPCLYVVAYVMMLIKPSSTECERIFSKCARFMTKYRATMEPDTMDRLVFCNGNPFMFERALKEMGQNWRPTNFGVRNMSSITSQSSLNNLSIDLEALVFNK